MSNRILSIGEIKDKAARIFDEVDFVERAYLFGSYARGEATTQSDLDFVVVPNCEIGLDFFMLYDLLQDAFERSVDVLHEREAYRIMPRNYEKDRILIYEQKN